MQDDEERQEFGERPSKSAPSAPSQKACTIAEMLANGNTIRAPAMTPRIPMNGVRSPTRRARSGSITNRKATPTVPAVWSASTTGLTSLRSLARSSPAVPRTGPPSDTNLSAMSIA